MLIIKIIGIKIALHRVELNCLVIDIWALYLRRNVVVAISDAVTIGISVTITQRVSRYLFHRLLNANSF